MMFKAQANLRIPFHDIDVMHIAWHGHYLKYFEIARSALMQELGLDWPSLKAQGIAMPVVESSTQYRRPILYNQEVVVEASIDEFVFPELIIHYKIMNAEDPHELHSTGRTRQVYMSIPEQSSYFVVPDFVLNRFESAARGTNRHETY